MVDRDDGVIIDDEAGMGPDPEARLGAGPDDAAVENNVDDDGAGDGIFYGTDPLADEDGLDARDPTAAEDDAVDPPPEPPPVVEASLDDVVSVADTAADEAFVLGEPVDEVPGDEVEAWVDPLPEPLADDVGPEWDGPPSASDDRDLDIDADLIG